MDRFRSSMGDTGRNFAEIARRFKRLLDGQMTRKRFVILFLLIIFFSLYVGPGLIRWIFAYSDTSGTQPEVICMNRYISPFRAPFAEHDVNLITNTDLELNFHKEYVSYIGNGHFGLSFDPHGFIYIKNARTLSLHIEYCPLFDTVEVFSQTSLIMDYRDGVVYKYACSQRGFDVAQKIYTHRTMPSLLVQEIDINNPTDSTLDIKWIMPYVADWPTIIKQIIKLRHGADVYNYEVLTGMVSIPKSDKVLAVSIVTRKLSDTVQISNRGNLKLKLYTCIEYSSPISKDDYANEKDLVEKRAIESMENIITLTEIQNKNLFEMHSKVWRGIWESGFMISDSKAQNALNGDRINATIYTVLSQVRMFEKEEQTSQIKKAEISRSLTYSEGCYSGHYTLQADDLWRPLISVQTINSVVNSWLLTLEKQGCHNLVHAGASGVIQAMILSFGSLHFSNQHLELKMHPSDLHRNFHFRRVNYGNMTHVNVSIVVHEDNKAALYVALDRSDRNYYACDAGCLDAPVQLGPAQKRFPVKLTDPLTAVLYITSDRQHMKDLQHAIHVKEVVLAPAHEHHVIALHKHGHTLGGLPAMFWVSICILIVLFHLFLCRIIMTEYCESSSNYNYRRLYNKP